jgi:hypothetical protein
MRYRPKCATADANRLAELGRGPQAGNLPRAERELAPHAFRIPARQVCLGVWA